MVNNPLLVLDRLQRHYRQQFNREPIRNKTEKEPPKYTAGSFQVSFVETVWQILNDCIERVKCVFKCGSYL